MSASANLNSRNVAAASRRIKPNCALEGSLRTDCFSDFRFPCGTMGVRCVGKIKGHLLAIVPDYRDDIG